MLKNKSNCLLYLVFFLIPLTVKAQSYDIAFGSCLHQDKPMPIIASIIKQQPQLMLFLGDNVYGDERSGKLTAMPAAYKKQQDNLADLFAVIPTEFIWDDHDYGLNDAGKHYPYKEQAKKLFLDSWQIDAKDQRVTRQGLYFTKQIKVNNKTVQIIFLDTRTFRSRLRLTEERNAPGKERYIPAFDSSKTMLGNAQWEWLNEQLSVAADIRIMASSTQVLAIGHGYEKWGNFPLERNRLINLFDMKGIEQVIILSGDRHRAAIYQFETPAGNSVLELTSSSLNFPVAGNETGVYRLGDMYEQENFGLLRIKEQDEVLKIRGEIRNIAGKVVRKIQIQ